MRIIVLLILMISTSWALDKQSARLFSELTKSYEDKMKSEDPDSAVVFISSRIETDYMDLKEVNIDSVDVTDGKLEINRPTSSSKIRAITECRSEQGGSVSIQSEKIVVDTYKLPIRILCLGDEGNYREAYGTINSGNNE